MPITERTLKRWRKEALVPFDGSLYEGTATGLARQHTIFIERILRMTQELLDQHLMRKVVK